MKLTDTDIHDILSMVESSKDIFESLELIKKASIDRVYIDVIRQESAVKTVIEKRDLPTRDLLMQKFRVGRAMAHLKLKYLKEKDLITEDISRNYTYKRGRKTVYALTPQGESVLKLLKGLV